MLLHSDRGSVGIAKSRRPFGTVVPVLNTWLFSGGLFSHGRWLAPEYNDYALAPNIVFWVVEDGSARLLWLTPAMNLYAGVCFSSTLINERLENGFCKYALQPARIAFASFASMSIPVIRIIF